MKNKEIAIAAMAAIFLVAPELRSQVIAGLEKRAKEINDELAAMPQEDLRLVKELAFTQEAILKLKSVGDMDLRKELVMRRANRLAERVAKQLEGWATRKARTLGLGDDAQLVVHFAATTTKVDLDVEARRESDRATVTVTIAGNTGNA